MSKEPMVKFGNTFLTKVVPVDIEDIVVSPIQLNPVARPRPVAFGSEFVRMSGATRNVTITFALLELDINARESAMQDLRDWAKIGTQQTLSLPQFSDRHLECVCTQLPDHSYRKWWENKLKIVFTCFDNPYWTSNDLIDVACGTKFTVGGSAPPLMTIERNGSSKLTNQSYTSNRGKTMTFTTIPAGSLVIDLNRQTAAIGTTSIMQYYTPTSAWIEPYVGSNQYINGNGRVKYRERWV